jgi:hypothetical protein
VLHHTVLTHCLVSWHSLQPQPPPNIPFHRSWKGKCLGDIPEVASSNTCSVVTGLTHQAWFTLYEFYLLTNVVGNSVSELVQDVHNLVLSDLTISIALNSIASKIVCLAMLINL